MRILILGAATGLSLALAAAPAPAATPYGWTPTVQLSATGDPAWEPEVAYSADGSSVIAWGRFDGTRYVAEAVRREADGTLGTVRNVATSDRAIDGPKVGIDADGDALLAWSRWDTIDYRVQARRMPPRGVLGNPVTLSDGGHDATEPELAVNQAGQGVIAWRRFDGDDFRAEGMTMATTNIVGLGDLEHVSDDGQEAREVDVAIDGAGNATFVWARYDTADSLINARLLRVSGTLEASRMLSVLGASAEEPEVAANEAGDVAFAWTRWDGQRNRVAGLVDLASSLPGTADWFSDVGEVASSARAGIDGAGNAIFAWQRWDGDDWRIQSARLPAGGVLAPVETHSEDGGSASDPRLAIEAGGTAAIAWRRWGGVAQRVQVRRLPATGAAWAVSTRSAFGTDAANPAVAVRTGGRILLAWQRSDGNDDQIEYSVGSPLTPPTGGAVPATPVGGVEPRP